MAGMPRKEVEIVLKHVEKQGATLKETKNGVMILFPDGSTAMTHWTTSDKNAFRPLRAAVKRAGLTWPGDSTNHKIQSSPATLKAIRKAFYDNNYKPMTTAELMQAVKVTNPTISRAHSSGELVKLKRGLYTLPELFVEKEEINYTGQLAGAAPEPDYPNIEHAKKLVEANLDIKISADRTGMINQLKTPEPKMDFIDERDSWTIDLHKIDPLATVSSLYDAYRAAGLEMEIRVWKSS